MSMRLRKLVLLSLLLVMPIQGIAAALGALACPAEAKHGTSVPHAHALHDDASRHHAEDAVPVQHGHSGDSSGAGEHSNHLCCHNVTSAAPNVSIEPPKAQLPVFVSSLSLLHTLFIPEQPQRPPKA